jgi:hypothetical protein
MPPDSQRAAVGAAHWDRHVLVRSNGTPACRPTSALPQCQASLCKRLVEDAYGPWADAMKLFEFTSGHSGAMVEGQVPRLGQRPCRRRPNALR